MLSELDIDVNEGTQVELQGHIGRFQVIKLYFNTCPFGIVSVSEFIPVFVLFVAVMKGMFFHH